MTAEQAAELFFFFVYIALFLDDRNSGDQKKVWPNQTTLNQSRNAAKVQKYHQQKILRLGTLGKTFFIRIWWKNKKVKNLILKKISKEPHENFIIFFFQITQQCFRCVIVVRLE